jgi:2-polyprenyl-6-hydroxyphenyl methylase/3-demethylubiquinone-9 3-methyltransferase
MLQAFENVASLVAPEGQLFISIYNDQGWKSEYWRWIKRQYNRSRARQLLLIALHLPFPVAARYAYRWLTGRLTYDPNRGMSLWHDFIDWLGGYPFEVASVEAVRTFFAERGFALENVMNVGRSAACNEFVFRKAGAPRASHDNGSPDQAENAARIVLTISLTSPKKDRVATYCS